MLSSNPTAISAHANPNIRGATLAAPERRVRVLSFHASYRCRDSGRCCTAGWPIPIEAPRLAAAERARSAGALTSASPIAFVRPAGAPAATPALVATHDGACVFYRGEGAARCQLHRALGHAALPLACQQFPRVSLVDPRGVSMTLSHYCPTAAALLDDPTPALVVTHSLPPMPTGGAEDVGDCGLDARDQLPPLLRPGLLMDWDNWTLWETRCVTAIEHAPDADSALRQIAAAVEHARRWSPADGPLADWIDRSFAAGSTAFTPPAATVLANDVWASIPEPWRPSREPSRPERVVPRVHRRFLAAHAFANWTAVLGQGLRTWLRSIEAAHALIAMGFGVDEADLRLRHLADPAALARHWATAERA